MAGLLLSCSLKCCSYCRPAAVLSGLPVMHFGPCKPCAVFTPVLVLVIAHPAIIFGGWWVLVGTPMRLFVYAAILL